MAQAQKVQLDDSQKLTELADKPGKSSFKAAKTGFEGREDELGKSIQTVLKTLSNNAGYAHEINDALVKAHLSAIQFAKDNGMLKEYVEHDLKTMGPINQRVAKVIEKTGDKEAALVSLTDRTACHYHLVLETKAEPGKRTWVSPFKRVLEASKRIGQFDLTEQEIHEQWLKPRLLGYARNMGVNLKVSDWNEDGVVTIELVD